MELEFRNNFLKDVQRIGSKVVKKKIAAVIDSGRSAKSLSDFLYRTDFETTFFNANFANLANYADVLKKRLS